MHALLVTLMMLTPPPELACLQKHYGVEPVEQDGTWFARLADGALLPFDDGKQKPFDEKLDAPDLHDMFAIPYARGAIMPVTTENHDPGRIRVERLFESIYGNAPERVSLTTVRFAGHKVKVHEKAAAAFLRVDARIARLLVEKRAYRKFVGGLGGTFKWRAIAGASRRSTHSYGIAIDLAVEQSSYWRWDAKDGRITWRNRMPQEIVDAFEDEGFIWGGRWYHYDTMHFEYRPELLDPACALTSRAAP